MDPWAADLVKDTARIVLGWALGLGSALLVECWRNRRKIGATKIAISRELREVAYRLLAVVYMAEGRKGRFDRKLLEWMQPQVERYAGPNPSEGFLAAVAGLLKASDAELAQLAAHLQATTPPKFLPKQEASYTTAVISQAHEFEPDYAVRVLDILAHLRMLDEARENGLYYHRLTFAGGLTSENHAKAVQNVDLTEDQLSLRARIIVDKITALEQKYPGDA